MGEKPRCAPHARLVGEGVRGVLWRLSAKSAIWPVGVGGWGNLDCSAVVSHARQRHDAAFRSYQQHYQDVRYRIWLIVQGERCQQYGLLVPTTRMSER